MEKAFEGKYRDILIQYLEHQDEEILYRKIIQRSYGRASITRRNCPFTSLGS